MKKNMLTTGELAEMLGVAPQTLRDWRMQGRGPAFLKLGHPVSGRVMYRAEDVDAWAQSRLARTRETPVDA